MSSGERKRRMVKPWWCDDPAGVAAAGLWGVSFQCLPVLGAVRNWCGS